MPTQFYVRSPKNIEKVRGPFYRSKLQDLVEKGKLRQDFEVSLDQQKWLPITKVKPPLFKTKETGQSAGKPVLKSKRKEIDLTVVEEYVPSGRCGKPWLIVPLAVVTPILVYLGMILGAGLGAIVGFILVGIPGMLLDQFLGGVIQEALGGLSVRGIGATLGTAVGILGGEAIGFWAVIEAFNKWSHNRSSKMATIFGFAATSITLAPYFLFSSQTLASLSPEIQSLMGGYSLLIYWGLVAAMVLTAIATFSSLSEIYLSQPYCETCHSFVDNAAHLKKFPLNGKETMDLAKQGAKDPLEKMLSPDEEAAKYTHVILKACDQKCCTYIFISYHWEGYNRETKQKEPRSEVKLEGLLGEKRSAIWKEILPPIEEADHQKEKPVHRKEEEDRENREAKTSSKDSWMKSASQSGKKYFHEKLEAERKKVEVIQANHEKLEAQREKEEAQRSKEEAERKKLETERVERLPPEAFAAEFHVTEKTMLQYRIAAWSTVGVAVVALWLNFSASRSPVTQIGGAFPTPMWNLILALLVLAGGISMLWRKSYQWAIVGSILLTIPKLGFWHGYLLPLGVWCLMLLWQLPVKNLFNGTSLVVKSSENEKS